MSSKATATSTSTSTSTSRDFTLFLCGDVMTGRGIDQVLRYPCDPIIYEGYMKSALGYVRLAEQTTGKIPMPVDDAYIWGDALREFDRVKPDVRIINLETTITRSEDWVPKGINYRMAPENIGCIPVANIDCCVLANNHILDWGISGLYETLNVLERAGLKTAGAGRNLTEAQRPAIIERDGTRVLVFAMGTSSSGVPESWGARADRPGVFWISLKDQDQGIRTMADLVRQYKQPGDIVVASIHWGSNWGYDVHPTWQQFAHRLIDEADVSIVHGHSSHHPRPLEIYKDRPILYGCGDFLNDYEGISGYEEFRQDLTLMYWPQMDPATGKLVGLKMTPMQIRHLKLNYPSHEDARWLFRTMKEQYKKFGCDLEMKVVSEASTTDGRGVVCDFIVRWSPSVEQTPSIPVGSDR